MNPSRELQEKVQEHFGRLCKHFYELSNDWDDARFCDEKMLSNMCVSLALTQRTFEEWWEMPDGNAKIRKVIREVTESLMKHDVPLSHAIDPEVAKFVWAFDN